MFGLISRKKLVLAMRYLHTEYNQLPPLEHRVPQIDTYEFYCGNINAVNYIAGKMKIKREELEEQHRGSNTHSGNA